jgi:hypothetical protein
MLCLEIIKYEGIFIYIFNVIIIIFYMITDKWNFIYSYNGGWV